MSAFDANIAVVRAMMAMEKHLQPSWESASNWGDLTEALADLIIRRGDDFEGQDITLLMSVGALCHRQAKCAASSEGGAA